MSFRKGGRTVGLVWGSTHPKLPLSPREGEKQPARIGNNLEVIGAFWGSRLVPGPPNDPDAGPAVTTQMPRTLGMGLGGTLGSHAGPHSEEQTILLQVMRGKLPPRCQICNSKRLLPPPVPPPLHGTRYSYS